jgi:hypothetical protein
VILSLSPEFSGFPVHIHSTTSSLYTTYLVQPKPVLTPESSCCGPAAAAATAAAAWKAGQVQVQSGGGVSPPHCVVSRAACVHAKHAPPHRTTSMEQQMSCGDLLIEEMSSQVVNLGCKIQH